MTKVEIFSIYSPGIKNLPWWNPPDIHSIHIGLELNIGESGRSAKGSDVYYLSVATPKGLLLKQEEGVPKTEDNPDGFLLSKRAILIVDHFNWYEIQKNLEQIVESCEASTYLECAEKLQRYFKWEYEDYQTP